MFWGTDHRLFHDHENNTRWMLKHMLPLLEEAQGNQMLSLFIPPLPHRLTDSIRLLDEEEASEPESDQLQNKISAREKLKQKLNQWKLMSKGLVMYLGRIVEENGLKRDFVFDFEPMKPVNGSRCIFDTKFHTQYIRHQLLEVDDKRYGVLVLGPRGILLGLFSSYSCKVLEEARNRPSALSSYLGKACQLTREQYFNEFGQPSIEGLILVGTQDLRTALLHFPCFPSEIRNMINNQVEGTDGGEGDFNMAINKSKNFLPVKMRMVREKRAIQKLFSALKIKEEAVVYGVDATLEVLERLGMLIISEHNTVVVQVLFNKATRETLIRQVKDDQDEDFNGWHVEKDRVLLLEWLATNYGRHGFILEIVTANTMEGHQFSKCGCEGIAGIFK